MKQNSIPKPPPREYLPQAADSMQALRKFLEEAKLAAELALVDSECSFRYKPSQDGQKYAGHNTPFHLV